MARLWITQGDHTCPTQHFTCKLGVRQGSIEEPILFDLFLTKALEDVFPHGDSNGVPLTTAHNKEQWTLQHLEYTDDLVLAADSLEIAQDLVTRLVATPRKYNMKIAPTKTAWMHIGGGEVPKALTVEGKRVARPQRVTYLGSVLDANGDPSSVVRANAQRAKQQIIRIRPSKKFPC